MMGFCAFWYHCSDIIMNAMVSHKHQRLDCLHNRLFRRISKKTSKLCVTGLCEGNSPVIDEFPAQSASRAENISIWWRHHGIVHFLRPVMLVHRYHNHQLWRPLHNGDHYIKTYMYIELWMTICINDICKRMLAENRFACNIYISPFVHHG